MKKKSFLGSMIICATLVTLLFAACKKEEASNATAAAATESNVVALNGSSSIAGLITKSDADALRSAYLKTAGANATEYIKFNIKDLASYLNTMQSKYNADEIYVNFGVYDAKTAPDKSYIGRTTIFFTTNNKKKGVVGNIVLNDGPDDDPNSLNHGTIYP